MEEFETQITGIVDVRVVESVSNYTQAVKLAVIAGVATVLATEGTKLVMHVLADKAKLRRQRQKNETKNEKKPE